MSFHRSRCSDSYSAIIIFRTNAHFQKSRRRLDHDAGNDGRQHGEAFTRAAAAENLSLGVDTVLFDANAADTLRPAGLRSYAVTLTPTALGATITQNDAMDKDLGALAGNVAAVAGSLSNIVFIADPASAVKISLRTNSQFPYTVFASVGLPAGTVMALAVNAFAVAADRAPRFSVTKATVVHMEDTTPLPIAPVGPGSFNVADRCGRGKNYVRRGLGHAVGQRC
jgi:hypothetical protein